MRISVCRVTPFTAGVNSLELHRSAGQPQQLPTFNIIAALRRVQKQLLGAGCTLYQFYTKVHGKQASATTFDKPEASGQLPIPKQPSHNASYAVRSYAANHIVHCTAARALKRHGMRSNGITVVTTVLRHASHSQPRHLIVIPATRRSTNLNHRRGVLEAHPTENNTKASTHGRHEQSALWLRLTAAYMHQQPIHITW